MLRRERTLLHLRELDEAENKFRRQRSADETPATLDGPAVISGNQK
jgi:hypothetical protein